MGEVMTELKGFDGKSKKAPVEKLSSLLSEEDHKALKAEAAKIVEEELKKEARAKELKRYIQESRGHYDPEEEQREIIIDVAGHADRILINGAEYWHGAKYTVSVSLYRCLQEIMARSWQHEDNVAGVNRDRYFRPTQRNHTLKPGMEGISAEAIMKV